jgi:hypothetical protein
MCSLFLYADRIGSTSKGSMPWYVEGGSGDRRYKAWKTVRPLQPLQRWLE